jgi:hypothetical protein
MTLYHASSRWAIGIAIGVIAVAGAVVLSPAFAGKLPGGNLSTSSTCNTQTQCLLRKNLGTGVAIKGTGTQNNGIVGQVTGMSSTEAFAAVLGNDLATPNPSGPSHNIGVLGMTTTGVGVYALAGEGQGLIAAALGGDAIEGQTLGNIPGNGAAGVFGFDAGGSSISEGVEGNSGTGIGVMGQQFELGKNLNAAFLGLTHTQNIITFMPAEPPGGLFNSDVGEGVVAEAQGSGAEALAAANFGGGPLIRAYAGSTEKLDLDNSGNLIIAGTLTQNGSPHDTLPTSTGRKVVLYGAMQTTATVEDFGEAQLSAGEAYVTIDPRFADTIDKTRTYLIFLTPQGDTAGLYVAQKTAAGFVVREHGARSNVVFDYRIVAVPFESQGARLGNAPAMPARGFTRSFVTRKPKAPSRPSILVHP